MAIDFPNSPTPGQVFQGYYWDNIKQAWRSNKQTSSSVITSSTTPTGATAGDLWFNTSDGTLSVFYSDGITSQWVEIQANVDNYKTPSQNYLINGGFDIWQRGTSFTSSSYTADRWYSPITGATVSQETSDLPLGFVDGIKFVTSTTGFAQFNQAIERDVVIPLRGKTVTLSGWVKISGSYTGNWISQALYSTSTDAYASTTTPVPGSNKNVANSTTTGWTRFSNTFTIPLDAVGLRIENIPDTQQPAGVTVRMTGIQLEEGSVATPFRRNQPNIQAELAACQRYCYVKNGSTSDSMWGWGRWESNVFFSVFQHPVQMRVPPTFTLNSPSGLQAVDPTIAWYNITGIGTIHKNGTYASDVTFTASGASVTNKTFGILAVNSGNPQLIVSAEL
jgi:hypothetical protein